jgi:transcriptional repressor NrdR
MRCPSCRESNKDRVIDSRMTEGGAVIRRRRVCAACGRRFTTKERVEEELRLTVVKRDESREPFERTKLMRGVRHACCKLPIDENAIERLVDTVEGDLFERFEREVTSVEIGEILLRRLRELNSVAYVRFAAVFRKYSDVDEFVDEIQTVREFVAFSDPQQASLFED